MLATIRCLCLCAEFLGCAILCCAVLCLLSAAELSSRLDLAGSEVADMRDKVQDMAQRMAERDEAVAAELHKFQHEQLAKQQQQLSDARAAAESSHAALNTLRDSLLAIHTALSPHSLATALGRSEGTAAGFSLGPEGYEQLTSRLLHEAQAVTAADGEAVAARVRELLAQVRDSHHASSNLLLADLLCDNGKRRWRLQAGCHRGFSLKPKPCCVSLEGSTSTHVAFIVCCRFTSWGSCFVAYAAVLGQRKSGLTRCHVNAAGASVGREF